MFYLAGPIEPTHSEDFIKALEGGIREVVTFPPDVKIVTLTGDYPAFDAIRIDLTEGRINTANRPEKPKGVGTGKNEITAGIFQIIAHPLHVDAGRISLDLSANAVTLRYDVDSSGRQIILPVSSESGTLKMEIPRADLEALILARATAAAAQQGAKITALELKLILRSERSLAIDLRVHAKKMMMGGVVHISGRVDLDDHLTARLSEMKCEGEGVAGKIAAGFLAPKIKQVDGRSFPLADESLNGLHLRDLRVTSVDPVRIEGAFGA